MTGEQSEQGPIEDYLDTLYVSLKGNPRQARRMLAEAEAHLRDAADAAASAGQDRLDAERTAVANFGPPDSVVSRPRLAAVFGELTYLGARLGAIGLVAVGVSGVVALVMNVAFGRSFVGNGNGSYSAADCRRYLTIWPHATSCAQAAVFEGSSDAVSLRVAAGVLGALVLVALWVWRKPSRILPAAVTPTIAATAFGGAAAWLLGQSVSMRVANGDFDGVGFFLSGGLVAAVAFAWWAVAFVRSIRTASVTG